MGWAIGYDDHWKRDVGYGVPAYCDEPSCNELIDRGLAYVCANGEVYGGDGCGLYFCDKHRGSPEEDEDDDPIPGTCSHKDYAAKPDHMEWIIHKLNDPSWAAWRKQNPNDVAAMRAIVVILKGRNAHERSDARA